MPELDATGLCDDRPEHALDLQSLISDPNVDMGSSKLPAFGNQNTAVVFKNTLTYSQGDCTSVETGNSHTGTTFLDDDQTAMEVVLIFSTRFPSADPSTIKAIVHNAISSLESEQLCASDRPINAETHQSVATPDICDGKPSGFVINCADTQSPETSSAASVEADDQLHSRSQTSEQEPWDFDGESYIVNTPFHDFPNSDDIDIESMEPSAFFLSSRKSHLNASFEWP